MSNTPHGLLVAFYHAPIKNEAKSAAEGRFIFEDREFVRIIVPGDKNSEIDRLVEPEDKTRFPDEYARFKSGARETIVGTPLEQWPQMTRSLVKEWEYLNVYTIEQLAGISDQAKQAFGMGANQWVQKAQAHLALAKDSAATERYAVENEELKRQIEELRGQIASISASVETQKRGPGRPPKVREDEAA